MHSPAEVAALVKAALKVTLGTLAHWREPEGKSRGPWPVWKSMLRARLWQEAEKGKRVSPQILNVRRLFGTEVAKCRVLPAAVGITGDFKTVEQQDPMLTSHIITVEATPIAGLVNEPPKRFLEIDRTLIVINGDIFEHHAPKAMCPTSLYEEMVRADTLISDLKLSLTICTKLLTWRQRGVPMMILTPRALATSCLFPSLVGQTKPSVQGILWCSAFAGC